MYKEKVIDIKRYREKKAEEARRKAYSEAEKRVSEAAAKLKW